MFENTNFKTCSYQLNNGLVELFLVQWEVLEEFEQRPGIIKLAFLKDPSGCHVANKMPGARTKQGNQLGSCFRSPGTRWWQTRLG